VPDRLEGPASAIIEGRFIDTLAIGDSAGNKEKPYEHKTKSMASNVGRHRHLSFADSLHHS
jgi:hypothetical protein